MGHLGLTPQSVQRHGGLSRPGPEVRRATWSRRTPERWPPPGASPWSSRESRPRWAAAISDAQDIPTIGIGAGPGCDGQVLVFHDLLGLNTDKAPKFVRRYADLAGEATAAIAAYAADVRAGSVSRRATRATV